MFASLLLRVDGEHGKHHGTAGAKWRDGWLRELPVSCAT